MNESPSLDAQKGAETAEERTLRIAAEEAELEQMLVQHGVSGDAADLLIEQLARKHKAEAELNAVFASLEDFDDYERHTSFTPSQRGEEVISPQNDSEGSDDDLAQDSEATADTASADEVHETAPRPLSREERAALAAELNTINGKLKEMWSVIRRYEADRADRVKKPAFTEGDYNVAVDTYNRLHAKAPELARAIGGKERLSGAVKIPDIAALRTYEKKTAAATREEREAKKQALSPSEKSAYHTAFGRRKDFVKALTDSGVHKDIAFGLYEEFAARAVGLQEFSDALAAELEAGHNPSIVPGDAYYELLKWFGIKDGPWSEVTTQINEVLAQLNTVPPPVPPRPERIVPITRMPKKQSDAVVPALSGIYEVRDDGHVYNSADTSPDAPRLDTDELLPSASDLEEKDGVLSGAAKANPPRVLTASRGAVAYDRDFDDELALEKKTLSALMKNKDAVRQPIDAREVNTESDPRLLGLYNIEHGVVRTGLTEGEGERVTPAEEVAGEPVDEHVSQEVIDGWAEQGVVIPSGTKASELGEILRKAGEAAMTPDAPPNTDETLDTPPLPGHEESVAQQELVDGNFSKESVLRVIRHHRLLGCDAVAQNAASLSFSPDEWWEVAHQMFANGGSWAFVALVRDVQGEGIFDSSIAEQMLDHGNSLAIMRNITKFNLEGLDPETRAKLEGTWKPGDATTEETGVEDVAQEEDENVFDPERALSKILKAPTAERRALLEAYKEKLAWQKKGLAEVQAAMEEDIRANPTMTHDEFVKLYMERAAEFGVTRGQKEIAEKVFARYAQKHEAVRSIREKYPDDKELFAALFGFPPEGDIEVIEGPMTLYFRIHNLDDYTSVFCGRGLSATPTVTAEMSAQASGSGGCALMGVLVSGLRGSVLAENAGGRAFEGYAKTTYVHEEQHAINQLFDWKKIQNDTMALHALQQAGRAMNTAKYAVDPEAEDVGPHRKEFAMHKAEERLELALTQYFRMHRERIGDGRAKDELLAYAKEGRPIDEVFIAMTKTKQEGGLYDYFAEPMDSEMTLLIAGLNKESASLFISKAEEIKARVFGPEYKELLLDGLYASERLRNEGYKEEAIRAVLMEEPLGKWQKVANRLGAAHIFAEEQNEAEKVKEKTEINHGVAKQFAERFGMDESVLEKIPGFTELSSGQQWLTLERMKAIALEDINTEKVKRYRARINELSQPSNEAITLSVAGIPLVDKLPTDFWNKMKVMGMRATKQFQIGRMKDEVSAEWLNASDSDAATMKQSALEGAVAQVLAAKEFDVVEKEGKLETEYISEKDFGENLDEATKTKIQNFNGIANMLTGKGFAGTDEELKQQYELGAREMTQLLAAQTKGRFGGEKAAVWRTKLEGAVQMARFFEDNPDLDKELDTAGKNIGAAISFKNLLTERGAIAGVSMGARWLGMSVLGLAAIPAVAAGVGGFMGWRRAKQELSENDLLAQMGERDTSDDAAQKEGGTNEKDRAKNVVSAERLTAKLEKLIGAYEQASDTETIQSPVRDEAGHLRFRDTPDAEGKNIDMETVSRKEALRRELEARVAYTTRKMEEQLVDLGASRGERAERISQFALTLGKAQAQLGFADRGSNAFAARMNDILDIREEKIEANRKVHLVKQAAKGAAFGVGFSTAGMLVGSILPSSAKAGSFGSGAVRAPEAYGEIMPPVSGSTEEAIAMAKRDGWVSDTVREMQEDVALNKAYVDKTMSLTSRSTDVGISDAELNALQATDNNPARAAAHAALLKAMELSNGRLSGDEVARIMVEHRIPSAIEEVNARVVAENAPHHGGEDVETIIHEAKSGDNLTKLMKGKLQIMSELTPAQQENVIQNFIHSVSPEELRSIGLTNVHKIAVGDKIDIGKLNEVLLAKRINGEDLFARARGLGGALHAPSAGVEATSASTGLMSRETIGTLPATEASLIEQYVGRPISGSESNVLHSVKLLRTIAENSEEQRLADAAFNHLQLAMREANRPLLLGEMKRILMGHGGMDARIQFPEVPPPYKSVEVPTTQGEVPLESEPVEVAAPHMEATPPFEAARSASTPAFTPEAIANWNSYTEMQKLPLARVAAGVYLKADTNRMFGIDVFGNPSKDWTGISALQAQFIFGPDSTMPATPDSPVEKILEYANTQGFTSEHGYVPMKGETVEQFLRRAQTMKILEDGPRGKQ